jgi:hypothetical protein
VVILRIDRLMRLNDELEQLIRLTEDTGVKVATVEGDIDLGTPSGRFTARVLVSVARNEMEVKSARQKLSNQQKARSGKPGAGSRAFGYEKDRMTIRQDEADTLRTMANKFISGQSALTIAQWANSAGFRTGKGNCFYPQTIRGLLTNPRYAGIRVHHDEQYKAVWEPIFDPVTWERLQLAVKARSTGLKQAHISGRKYLLTGLMYCGNCGFPLSGSKRTEQNGTKYRVYRCHSRSETQLAQGCGRLRRNAVPLEHFIVEQVLYRLDTPELGKLLSESSDNSELTAKLNERETITERIGGLVDDYASGLLTKHELARAKGVAEAQLAEANKDISRLNRSNVGATINVGETLRQSWENNDLEWRRRLIQTVVKRVTVLASHKKPKYLMGDKLWRFDAEAIQIEWIV